MPRRQIRPTEWVIISHPLDRKAWRMLMNLPHCSGILIIGALETTDHRKLRLLANLRRHTVVVEGRDAAIRIHSAREMTRALGRRPRIVLLSPMFKTSSHPDWLPMPRMRAAALARLQHREVLALGGMNRRRYARLASLGFSGWAAISAFRT